MQHVNFSVQVLVNDVPLSQHPRIISASECNTFPRFTSAIKREYGSVWKRVPGTVSTEGIVVNFPFQKNSAQFATPRVFADWYRDLGLYFANPANAKDPQDVRVILKDIGEVTRCYFTDGDEGPNVELAAMDKTLGIGQEEGSDSLLACSRNWVEGIEHAQKMQEGVIEMKDEIIEMKDEEIEELKRENVRLRSLMNGKGAGEAESKRSRMRVGGLSLPGYKPTMERKM